jgi:hypothetical protein
LTPPPSYLTYLPLTLKDFLYLAALVVFAFGCRSFDNRWLQKLGWLCLLAASYLLAWLLTKSHIAGACAVLVWFLLPWLEIAGRVRRLRFPIRNEIKSRFPPSREVFPELGDLTSEVLESGFEEIEDAGWSWHDTEHFVRLFYHQENRTQASISLALQNDLGFSYISLTSRQVDGRSLTTSNFPFPPTMRFAPSQHVNRCLDADSLHDLVAAHDRFLQREGVKVEDLVEPDTEQLAAQLANDMSKQIDHNLERGLIEPLGEGEFRYSWRGCLFLWLQIVKDMLLV